MKSKAAVYLFVLGLMWGASYLFIKVCTGHIPLFTFIGGRMLLGAGILFGVLLLEGDAMPPLGRAWLPFLVLGMFSTVIPFTLIVWGEHHISSSLAAVLNSITPLFTVLLANRFIPDERLTVGKLVGIALGTCGIVIVVWPELVGGVTFDLWGELAVVGASVSYAIGIVYAREKVHDVRPIKTAIGMLASGCVLTLPLILLLENPLAIQPPVEAWLSWVALAVFGTAVAYLLYYWLVGHAGATYTSLVSFMMPPVGVFWGALILGERMEWLQVGGTVVIVISIMLVNGYLDRWWRRLAAPQSSS